MKIPTLEAAVNSKAEARARECLRPGPICHQYENEETELLRKSADVHASQASYDWADILKAGITADQLAIDALPAITNADPQAASMTRFLQWASFGCLGPSFGCLGPSTDTVAGGRPFGNLVATTYRLPVCLP